VHAGIDLKPKSLCGAAGAQQAGRNALLDALPRADWERLRGQFSVVELAPGQLLHAVHGLRRELYFPLSGLVSVSCLSRDGACTEIAMIGDEGVVGVSALMGGEAPLAQSVVHGAGMALRIPAAALRREFERSSALRTLMLRYTRLLMAQMARTALCGRHHSLEQRLCRWLLMRLDRLGGNEVPATHEVMADMLGARRAGVSELASKLQKDGIIGGGRGQVLVFHRPRLEARSCECYELMRRETEALIPRRPGSFGSFG